MDPILNETFVPGQTPITARWLNALIREVRKGISIEGFDLSSGPEGHAFRRRRQQEASPVVWVKVTSTTTGIGPHTVSVWTKGFTNAAGVQREPDLTEQVATSPGFIYAQSLLTGQPYLALDMGDHYELLPEVART